MAPLRALASQALASFEYSPFGRDHLYTRSVKAAFDPKRVLNPGRMFEGM